MLPGGPSLLPLLLPLPVRAHPLRLCFPRRKGSHVMFLCRNRTRSDRNPCFAGGILPRTTPAFSASTQSFDSLVELSRSAMSNATMCSVGISRMVSRTRGATPGSLFVARWWKCQLIVSSLIYKRNKANHPQRPLPSQTLHQQ